MTAEDLSFVHEAIIGQPDLTLQQIPRNTSRRTHANGTEDHWLRIWPDRNDVNENGPGTAGLWTLPSHGRGHGQSRPAGALEGPGGRTGDGLGGGLPGLSGPGRFPRRLGLA